MSRYLFCPRPFWFTAASVLFLSIYPPQHLSLLCYDKWLLKRNIYCEFTSVEASFVHVFFYKYNQERLLLSMSFGLTPPVYKTSVGTLVCLPPHGTPQGVSPHSTCMLLLPALDIEHKYFTIQASL